MCGLTGLWEFDNTSRDTLLNVIESMTASLFHRGPDDGGYYLEPDCALALGFRRLAIVDLSPEGHQPMSSVSGRYEMVFNGEVYNHNDLRKEMQERGYSFRGHSDTEVMLACIEEWGLEAALRKFWGMFGIALWDRQERTLTLVRDRFGVKPMYWGRFGSTLVFGSELKALRAHPRFPEEVDRDVLALYVRHGYIPHPYSIYKGVQQLPPGAYITFCEKNWRTASPVTYWSAHDEAAKSLQSPFKGTDAEALGQLDALLRAAVGIRMVADVPVGAFLSGGIDSPLIVALMQAQSRTPVRTFTIGFEDKGLGMAGFNEAVVAKQVAEHLGTDHTELYLTHKEAMAVIPKMPQIYDEPFADDSQIPTYLVSQLARKEVTVSLSGDGGDEFFGGYTQYRTATSLWESLMRIPAPLRGGTQLAMQSTAPLLTALPTSKLRRVGNSFQTRARYLKAGNPDSFYKSYRTQWEDSERVVVFAEELPYVLSQPETWVNTPDLVHRMMYADSVHYMPDSVLTKLDRASMAVSLEGRNPLLDHRVYEFAWTLPLSMKIREGQGKWILRQLLYKYVPQSLIDRPKRGFGVPVGDWLREGLRDWAEELLSEESLRTDEFFNPAPIRKRWEEHCSHKNNWGTSLWTILMFQAWRQASK